MTIVKFLNLNYCPTIISFLFLLNSYLMESFAHSWVKKNNLMIKFGLIFFSD